MAKVPNKILFNDEILLDLTEDTATTDNVLSGIKFHSADGSQKVGTCTFNADTSNDTAEAEYMPAGMTAHNAQGEQITGIVQVKQFLQPSDFELGSQQTIEDEGVTLHYYPMEPDTTMYLNKGTFAQSVSVQEVINILQQYISPIFEDGMIVYNASVFQGAIDQFFMRLDSSSLYIKIPDGLVNAEELLSNVNVTPSSMLKGTIAVNNSGEKIEGQIGNATIRDGSISINNNGLITAELRIDNGVIDKLKGYELKSFTQQLSTTLEVNLEKQNFKDDTPFTKYKYEFTPTTEDTLIANPRTFLDAYLYVKGDSNLVAENIKSGTSIFGVEGSLEIPTFSTIRTVSSESEINDSIGIEGDIIMVV